MLNIAPEPIQELFKGIYRNILLADFEALQS